jgi:hypothetical protein
LQANPSATMLPTRTPKDESHSWPDGRLTMTALTKVNVAEKSNEIVAIPIVTIDAMGCQQRGLNEHTKAC